MTAKIERTELDALAQAPAAHWTQLTAEFRMLCRGLEAASGWAPQAVTTFVGLPGDAEYAQALATLCRRLAGEYDLDCTLTRRSDDWCVRFMRPQVAPPIAAPRAVFDEEPRRYGLIGGFIRACGNTRRRRVSAEPERLTPGMARRGL